MIQVGISTVAMQNALNQTVWNIGLLTIGIILLGIGLTVLLTNRIITRMQRLAKAAHQIATGNIHVSVIPDSQDEVGQLTHSINQMAEGLQQRETFHFDLHDHDYQTGPPTEYSPPNWRHHYVNPRNAETLFNHARRPPRKFGISPYGSHPKK